jgi:hypothetical protein
VAAWQEYTVADGVGVRAAGESESDAADRLSGGFKLQGYSQDRLGKSFPPDAGEKDEKYR